MKPDPAATTPEVTAEPHEAPSALLDSILEATPAAPSRLALPSGRAVEARASADGERVTVRGTSGEVEVEILLTERGPVLRMRAVDLELSAQGAVRVDCEQFHVRAEKGIVEETGGELALRAQSAKIEAARGNVEVEANDDVVLHGERVKLNC